MARCNMWVLMCAIAALSSVVQGDSVRIAESRRRLLFPVGRIVGGIPTDISQVPYQLQLEEHGFQFCGASIISPQYALTAAHCTSGKSAYSLQVRSGTTYRVQGGTLTQVTAIHQHPQYSPATTDFDVSVLRLASPIPFAGEARAVSLAYSEPRAGQALVSGWGVQSEGSSSQPFQLLSVLIPIRERSACTSAYGSQFTDNMICAGGPGEDSCQGDSGGPLVVGGVQVGIVSWGYGCARYGYPGVYTNVAGLRSFIDAYTGYQAKWLDPENFTETDY